MTQRILISFLATAILAFASWRVIAVHQASVPQFAVVEDPSFSHQEGCLTWLGIADNIMNSNDAAPGSNLMYFTLGDRSTSDEPRQRLDVPVPVNRRAIQSEGSRMRRQADLLDLIAKRCEETTRTDRSPIFLAVKQAISALRSKGCKSGTKCQLIVDSDLEENGDHAMANAIAGRRTPASALPAPINNGGINVSFCGFAATFGARTDVKGHEYHLSGLHDPKYEDRLHDVWLARFTNPELVTFAPYCPSKSANGIVRHP